MNTHNVEACFQILSMSCPFYLNNQKSICYSDSVHAYLCLFKVGRSTQRFVIYVSTNNAIIVSSGSVNP